MTLIPEPSVSDETWGRRGEQPLAWLSRSTLPRAVAARAFLNRNLAHLHEADQPKILSALRTRWQPAFFELIVARTLQLLGASISIEPESQAGPRIDFRACFDDATVNVEAVCPMTDSQAVDVVKARNPLLDMIESCVPDGWGVGVSCLPTLGFNDSKKPFKRVIKKMLEEMHLRSDAVDLIEELPQGRIHLRLWPNPPDGVKILHEAPIDAWDDTESRIRAALQGKKRQARAAVAPTLVAIHVAGLLGDFEDFDLALYGRRVMILDQHRMHVATRFDPDGLFAARRPEPPAIDGVLAFLRVGFRSFAEPVLYHHPRSSAVLPEPLLALERRMPGSDYNEINSMPSRNEGFLAPLGFVPESV